MNEQNEQNEIKAEAPVIPKSETGASGADEKGKASLPLISICAVAFNHAAYIRQALDHFLAQKGPFRIEILIHDDASTDGTAEIIRMYETQYPDIVKPILQKSNQYSKGIWNLSGAFNFPRVAGTYVALMDCDDYWCAEDKLATQLAYMETHADCQLCVHGAEVRNEKGELINRNLMRPYRGDRDLSAEELIDKAGSFPFGSMMLRSELVRELPDWYVNCPVGDRPLELMAAAKGYCHYIDRAMSVYRFNGAGSWTNSMKTGDYKQKQDRNLMRPYRGDRDLSAEELIDKAGSFPFGSMMLRSELVRELPDWYVNCPVGDRPLELMAAAKGYCHYIDRAMSVYRFNGAGSWTNSMKTGDYKQKQDRYAQQMKEMYDGFDRSTGGRYRREAASAARRVYFLTRVNLRDFSGIYALNDRRYYRELPGRERALIRLERHFPRLYRWIRSAYFKGKRAWLSLKQRG